MRTGKQETQLVFGLVAFFVLALTLHATLSRTNLDHHGDMAENYAWGMLWQWGYFKHPPFFGWVTAAWFSVFPRENWAYYLLSSVNAAAVLLIVWRIAARYGNAWFAVLVVCLAIVMPPISFLGVNYNANAAMTPVWAGIFLFYLRGMETRKLTDAAILGLLAAISILTKYHSAVLLVALFVHAVLDRDVRPILFSRFGLVVLAVFCVVLTPHLVWLVSNDFLPIGYAEKRAGAGIATFLYFAGLLIVSPLFYAALSMLFALMMRDRKDGFDRIPLDGLKALTSDAKGRALIAYAIGPMILTIGLAAIMKAEISAVWGIPFYPAFAIILALLVPKPLLGKNINRVLLATSLFLVIIVAIGPYWRTIEMKETTDHYQVPLQEMVHKQDAIWQKLTGGAMHPVIFGDLVQANSSAFYSTFRPIVLQANSLVYSKGYLNPELMERHGMMATCQTRDTACLDIAKSLMPSQGVTTEMFSLPGFDATGQWDFTILAVAPKP
jgi:4-amino-4-deoxy-L-arabinose transferase-like glycosyltransferase